MRIRNSSSMASSQRVAALLKDLIADENHQTGRKPLALDACGVCVGANEQPWLELSELFQDLRGAVANGIELYNHKKRWPDVDWKMIDITNAIHGQQVLRAGYRVVFVDSHEQQWAQSLPAQTLLVARRKEGWAIRRGQSAPYACPPFPLTDIQHAYWLGRGQSLHLGGVSCHVYFEWHIESFDLPRFERAWNRVITRHGMLRAHLTPSGEQVILATVPWYPIARHDLTALATAEAEDRAIALRDEMCGQVLAAESWPLFRIDACQWADGKCSLHIDLDLLAFDVRSFHIVLSEAVRYYQDSGFEPAPLRYSFEDYQRQDLLSRNSPEYAGAKAWWLDRIDALPPPPQLPVIARPADIEAPTFIRLQHRLDKAQWLQIKERAAQHKLTHTAVLMAAFSEVLANYCERGDFTINMTQFNRKAFHPDAQKIVGDFTSVLLVDCAAAMRLSFAERASAIGERIWENLSRSEYGGVAIIRELSKRKKLGASATMPVVFTSLLGMDLDDLVKGADLLGEPVHLYTETPQIWLDHQTMVRKGALEFNWIYIRELFDPGLIERMFADYGHLLASLAASAAAWAKPVASFGRKAEQQVLTAANATAGPRRSANLGADFLAQAEKHPERTAIITASTRLSYGDLADWVAGICQKLDESLGNDGRQRHPVVVHSPKGLGQIAASLAVVLSGRILVPTSVEWPSARIKTVAHGANAGLILCAEGHIDPDEIDLPVLSIDQMAKGDRHGLTARGEPSDVAYIIYTSGSTGTPKGVAMQHDAVLNTLDDVAARIDLGPQDRVFGISALSFDLAIFDTFATLGHGAALVLPRQEDHKNSAAWLDLFAQEGDISVWNSVPQLLAMVLEVAAERSLTFPELRYVLLSGDWVQADLIGRARDVFPRAELICLGGATEAAIWSNWFDAGRSRDDWRQMPYGFPLRNQSYRVFDAALRSRPLGVAGDLYIGGVGLAKGYWGQPQLTAAAFIHHPGTGECLYRTGDIGKYHRDGTLEFLGRRDSQVKLGGYRVELGEIEAVLQSHPQVKTAVAVVRGSAQASPSLACWVVPEDPAGSSSALAPSAGGEDAAAVLAAAGARAAADTPAAEYIAAIAAFNRGTEQAAPLVMLSHLQFLGFPTQQPWSLSPTLAKLGIHPAFHDLMTTWHEVLVASGFITRLAGDRFQLSPAAPQGAKLDAAIAALRQDMADHLSWFFEDNPGILAWIFLPSAKIAAALKNPRQANQLMFDQGSAALPESLYKRNEIARYLGQIVAAVVAEQLELVAKEPGDASVAILELGAGIGGLSHYVLPVVSNFAENHGFPVRYHYTDISAWFMHYAQETFGHYDVLRPGLYDINAAAKSQGFEPDSFAAILASNSLHNAMDLSASLRDAYTLLRPGGLFVLIEATRENDAQLVTAAIMEFAARGDSADQSTGLLGEEIWTDQALSCGFEAIGCWPQLDSPLGATYQRVLAFRKPGSLVDTDELLSLARRQLPRYMVPKAVYQLPKLPLNANGKVDRAALAAGAERDAPQGSGGQSPATATERKLAELWASILAISPDLIKTQSSFFDLGGDSLLATQLALKIAKAWQKEFAIQEIFLAPELKVMATKIDALPETSHGGVFFPMTAAGAEGPRLYLCHGSDGLYGPFAELAQHLTGQVRCFGLQASGFAPNEPVLTTLHAMAERAIAAMAERPIAAGAERPIAARTEGGRTVLGGWSMGASLALEMAYLLEQRDQPVDTVLLIEPLANEAIAPFLGSEYKLWRFSAADAAALSEEQFSQLARAERIALWRDSLGGAKAFSDEDIARWVAILKANVNAIANQPIRHLSRTETVILKAEHSPFNPPAEFSSRSQPPRIVTIAGYGHHDILSSAALHSQVAELVADRR